MPWNETTVMDERYRFVTTYLSGHYTLTELCARYEISRPTGRKWVQRFKGSGMTGLQDRSRAPHECPHRMSAHASQWLLQERRTHPLWGPRKLLRRYQKAFPVRVAPSRTALAGLLKKAGLSAPRTARKRPTHGTYRRLKVYRAHDLWTIDFKGQFRTGDRRYCYPLTVMEHASRYLLSCHGQYSTEGAPVLSIMQRLFEEHGMPAAIHSDNGSPFCSTGVCQLSRLSVYWLKLGIQLQRSRPGCPQDNGAHERMHRTLKAATTRPPAQTLRTQQQRFDHFRHEYNFERPHETLNDRTPAEFYQLSPRPYPSPLPSPTYPGHFEVRRVAVSGCIKWRGRVLFIGAAFATELLGLEEIQDGIWSICFAQHLLARFDERTRKLIDLPLR
jgi:putative transposase